MVYDKILTCYECGQTAMQFSMYQYAGEYFCSPVCVDDFKAYIDKSFAPLIKKRKEYEKSSDEQWRLDALEREKNYLKPKRGNL